LYDLDKYSINLIKILSRCSLFWIFVFSFDILNWYLLFWFLVAFLKAVLTNGIGTGLASKRLVDKLCTLETFVPKSVADSLQLLAAVANLVAFWCHAFAAVVFILFAIETWKLNYFFLIAFMTDGNSIVTVWEKVEVVVVIAFIDI
jgi:hypothetical protein